MEPVSSFLPRDLKRRIAAQRGGGETVLHAYGDTGMARRGGAVTFAGLVTEGPADGSDPEVSRHTLKDDSTLPTRNQQGRPWPSYETCVAGAPLNLTGTGKQLPRADYTWCLTARDWGWSVEQIAAKLPRVSAEQEWYRRQRTR